MANPYKGVTDDMWTARDETWDGQYPLFDTNAGRPLVSPHDAMDASDSMASYIASYVKPCRDLGDDWSDRHYSDVEYEFFRRAQAAGLYDAVDGVPDRNQAIRKLAAAASQFGVDLTQKGADEALEHVGGRWRASDRALGELAFRIDEVGRPMADNLGRDALSDLSDVPDDDGRFVERDLSGAALAYHDIRDRWDELEARADEDTRGHVRALATGGPDDGGSAAPATPAPAQAPTQATHARPLATGGPDVEAGDGQGGVELPW